MDKGVHQSLREATALLLRQGKVEDLIEMSLDYIFSMLSRHSDRLENLEHSHQSLNVRMQRRMEDLKQQLHEVVVKSEEVRTWYDNAAQERATAMSAAAQQETEIVIKKKERCARHSEVERHEEIISAEQGLSVTDATNSDDTMSLALAIQTGQLSTVKYLLTETDADVECHPIHGTPLLHAALFGHLDILEYLVFETSADYEATNPFGNNALGHAATFGHTEAVKFLWTTTAAGLEQRDLLGRTPLLVASSCGHVAVLKYLLHEASANAEAIDNHGRDMLATASMFGHLEVVNVLVSDFRVNTGRTNDTGMTPLLEASSNGHRQIVRYLLRERSASIDDSCSHGGTCLHHAAAQGRLKLLKYLRSNCRVNISATDRDGRDPLYWASSGLGRASREFKSDSGGITQGKLNRLRKTVEYLKTWRDERRIT